MREPSQYDVAVMGAGIAGLAACVLLRNAGLRVVCVDEQPFPHHPVGESLDWSSPALLARLGLDVDRLLQDDIATPKKKIIVHELGERPWVLAPPAAIGRWPLRFETVTLHVDRTALDARLFERADALGTAFVWERAARVEMKGERMTGCVTASGRCVSASWFVDATGAARLFAREMAIPVVAYGRPKVCLWTYFDTAPLGPGTTFFVDNRDAYLQWIWDIPISSTQTSVGLVASAEAIRDRRRAGEEPDAILRSALRRYGRFDSLLDAHPALRVERTAFQPYVTTRTCGANWLIIGEAAAMPDPLTGNGLTSGIRHALHAADAIAAATGRDGLSRRAQRNYGRHVQRLGAAFNSHIERALYEPSVRQAMGFRNATYVYTFFAFFMNALHARFDPRGRGGMAAFGVLFGIARAWVSGATLVARALPTRRVARFDGVNAAR